MNPAVETPLPSPGRTRWQPLRVGLVDLFYYDVEEFHFRDGRLLLRGNNGTGQVQGARPDPAVPAGRRPVPAPGRTRRRPEEADGVEPPARRRAPAPRTARLHLDRVRPPGRGRRRAPPHTLGCGLKAVGGRGIARHWFFVTDQRDRRRTAAAGLHRRRDDRDRLAEALDGRGLVHDSARSYRRAVDEALFGLGEQRYAALVDLLIQLRQPQLSKRPSEKALSQALTESLPPMDQAVVADVAEAFRSLDEEKEQLGGHGSRRARRHRLPRALPPVRPGRRPAQGPRAADAALPLRVAARRTEHRRTATSRQPAACSPRPRHELEELDRLRTGLQARDAALRAGPEMRSARELEQAADLAERTARDAERAEADLERAEGELARYVTRLGAARSRAEAAERARDSALAGAGTAAAAAGLESEHADRVRGPLVAGEPPEGALRGSAEFADRRLRSVSLVEEQLAAPQVSLREARPRQAAVGGRGRGPCAPGRAAGRGRGERCSGRPGLPGNRRGVLHLLHAAPPCRPRGHARRTRSVGRDVERA